jgi:hypothetical protein
MTALLLQKLTFLFKNPTIVGTAMLDNPPTKLDTLVMVPVYAGAIQRLAVKAHKIKRLDHTIYKNLPPICPANKHPMSPRNTKPRNGLLQSTRKAISKSMMPVPNVAKL